DRRSLALPGGRPCPGGVGRRHAGARLPVQGKPANAACVQCAFAGSDFGHSDRRNDSRSRDVEGVSQFVAWRDYYPTRRDVAAADFTIVCSQVLNRPLQKVFDYLPKSLPSSSALPVSTRSPADLPSAIW